MVVFIVAGMSVIDSPPVVSALVADAELVRVLDQLDHTSIIALTDTDLLASINVKTGLLARLQAFLDAELVEAETRGVTQTAFGVTTATWLAATTNAVDGRQAGRRMKQAVDIGTPVPGPATSDAGRHGVGRAGRRHLHRPAPPPHRPRRGAVERADRQLVDFAATYNPTELRRLGNRLVDVIAPAVAEADAAAYLQRIEADAHRTRSLRFHDDHHGNWRFHGQLPIVEGTQLAELIHALATKGDTTRTNTTDDQTIGREERCWSANCADALLEIIHTYQASGQAPASGGDRPRINVTIDLATLQGQLGHAHRRRRPVHRDCAARNPRPRPVQPRHDVRRAVATEGLGARCRWLPHLQGREWGPSDLRKHPSTYANATHPLLGLLCPSVPPEPPISLIR